MKKLDSLISDVAPSDKQRHLKAEVARLTQALASRKQDSGQITAAMEAVLAEVPLARPPKMQFTQPKAGPGGSPLTHVVHATDWHIGETVPPEHVEDFNCADYATAVQRVGTFGHKVVAQTAALRNAYAVEACHVIGTADWVSGGIHPELLATNEFPEPVQAVRAGFLLGSFITGLSAHFPQVDVDVITAGNHDRLTRKAQCADGGINSWGYVVCEIAKQHVSTLPNVRMRVHCGLSAIVEVAGTRYLITHGDGIMGTWGIPFYGIERKKQREAMARMNMEPGKHFDKIIIGHFHEALNHQHWMIGGSLTGTNEFDHKAGRHCRPHQTSWFVHPKHGEFAWQRWWL
jgi:hypothetical protein